MKVFVLYILIPILLLANTACLVEQKNGQLDSNNAFVLENFSIDDYPATSSLNIALARLFPPGTEKKIRR